MFVRVPGSNQLCGCVIDGELHVTSYRVVFHPIGCGSVPSFASQSTDWEMPVRALTACSLKVESGHKLSFKCKDGQRRVFTCAPRDGAAALACARAVHALAFSSASDAFARVCCGVLSVPSWWNLAACAPSTRRHSRAERSILTRPRAGLQSRLHRGPRVRPSFPENISLFLRDEYANSVLRGPAADQLKIIRNEHALDICETYPLGACGTLSHHRFRIKKGRGLPLERKAARHYLVASFERRYDLSQFATEARRAE